MNVHLRKPTIVLQKLNVPIYLDHLAVAVVMEHVIRGSGIYPEVEDSVKFVQLHNIAPTGALVVSEQMMANQFVPVIRDIMVANAKSTRRFWGWLSEPVWRLLLSSG